MNRVHVILALGLVAIGLVLVFDALSSHALEWPLGLFVLVVGVIWLVGRIAFSATQPSRRNGGLPIRHLVGEFIRVPHSGAKGAWAFTTQPISPEVGWKPLPMTDLNCYQLINCQG